MLWISDLCRRRWATAESSEKSLKVNYMRQEHFWTCHYSRLGWVFHKEHQSICFILLRSSKALQKRVWETRFWLIHLEQSRSESLHTTSFKSTAPILWLFNLDATRLQISWSWNHHRPHQNQNCEEVRWSGSRAIRLDYGFPSRTPHAKVQKGFDLGCLHPDFQVNIRSHPHAPKPHQQLESHQWIERARHQQVLSGEHSSYRQ